MSRNLGDILGNSNFIHAHSPVKKLKSQAIMAGVISGMGMEPGFEAHLGNILALRR